MNRSLLLSLLALSLLFVLPACDADDDGVTIQAGDCDDTDANNFPGNTEVCDGQDNDCNGSPDADADGEVDADSDGSLSCDDCDDLRPTIAECPECSYLTFSSDGHSLQTSGFDWGTAPVTELTVEAWFQSDAPTQPSYAKIATQHLGCNANNSAFALAVYSGTDLVGFVCTNASNSTSSLSVGAGSEMADGLWHHAAFVWTSDLREALYIDGILVAEVLSGVAGGSLLNPSLDVGIGRIPLGQAATGSQNFVGSIGPVRISNVARYDTATSFVPEASYTTDIDTVALYAMDEGSGSTVADDTGLNAATITGAAWNPSCP